MCVDLRPDSLSDVYRRVLQYDTRDLVGGYPALPDSARARRQQPVLRQLREQVPVNNCRVRPPNCRLRRFIPANILSEVRR
jgi:hypothetical protein